MYWLEDTVARQAVGSNMAMWTEARASLPSSKTELESLKADLWSEVVKGSQHQDAWTWGKMFLLSCYSGINIL